MFISDFDLFLSTFCLKYKYPHIAFRCRDTRKGRESNLLSYLFNLYINCSQSPWKYLPAKHVILKIQSITMAIQTVCNSIGYNLNCSKSRNNTYYHYSSKLKNTILNAARDSNIKNLLIIIQLILNFTLSK